MIRKSILVFCLGVVAMPALHAANKEQKRLENSGVVMQEIMNTPENIPQEVLEKADCVIVFPSVLKAAFVVGGPATAAGPWFAERGKTSRDRGALQQCMRWKAAVSDFKLADKQPISFCCHE